MMKIRALLFFAVFCVFINASFAQQLNKSYWSLTLEGGANQFDGDMDQVYNGLLPNSHFKMSFGASVEYTLTPIWGIGLEYYYLPLSAQNGRDGFISDMHHLNPYVAVNVLNLFDYDIKTKWGIWATLGGGLDFYNSTFYTDNVAVGAPLKDGRAIIVPAGVILEYNLSKSLALGAKVQYRSHNKDNIEGHSDYNFSGVTNDYISVGMLNLRWKIGAVTKNHIRNLNFKVFSPEEAMIPARLAKAKADSLQLKVDSLRNEVETIRPKIDRIESALNELKNSKSIAGNVPVNLPEKDVIVLKSQPNDIEYYTKSGFGDGDKDGVADNRDKEPQTPENTAVDFWGRTITDSRVNGFASVYFDFDRTDLDADAIATIKLVVEKLRANPDLMVEVRGYADFVGDERYNRSLSQRRSDKVKNELVAVYGISPVRIISNGKGTVLEPKTAYRLNRRCNFYFSE